MANEVMAEDDAAILDFLPGAAEFLHNGAEKAEADPDPDKGADESEEEEEAKEPEEEQEDGEAKPDESEDEGDKGSEKVQRRIDKLIARAKTAEEALTQAKAEAEAARAKAEELESKAVEAPVILAPSAADPLSDVNDKAALLEKMQQVVAVKRWCIENPEGGTVADGKGNDIEIDVRQVRKMLADAEEMITLHGPRRANYLEQRDRHEAEAREIYPELYKPGSEMAKAMNNLVKAWPEVVRFPDYKLVLGDYIRGNQLRTKKAAVEEPKKKTAIAPPVPKVSVQKSRNSATNGQAREHVLDSGGSLDSLINYFAG